MKNKYIILKILLIILSLGFLLWFSLNRFWNQEPKLKIRFADETPIFFINNSTIHNIVTKINPSNKIKNINIGELEKTLMNLPSVKYTNVYLESNGTLNIEVKQKVPIIRINNSGNQYYLDDSGNKFPLSKEYSHSCMLVSGNIHEEDYIKLIILVKKINASNFYRNYFIGINKYNDDYILFTNEGYFKVQFGDLENIDLKLIKLKIFIEKHLNNKNYKKYKQISVKYNNQIVATLR